MPDGIVHQVGHEALGQAGVSGGDGRGEAGLDAHAQAGGFLPAAVHDPSGYLGEVKGFPAPQPTLAARQCEQRVDEAFLLLSELKQLLAGCPQRFGARVGIGECHLQDGSLGRQRGAQLVGRVRDEMPLGVERGLQTGEQAVQRVTEFPEFVIGVGQSQPLIQAARGNHAGGGSDDPERP
jgi:coenzyme F420-reducing hydrogenase delta subunit